MDIFTILFYQPVYNLIIFFYRLMGENLGLAIVAIALITRVIMLPLIRNQAKMTGMNMEASEKMKEVREKYKDDKQKQNEEMMKVNSEYMPGVLAGCLPLIVQLILFINIDRVIRDIFSQGVEGFAKVAYTFVPAFPEGYKFNSSFFGIVDLGKTASEIGLGTLPEVIPYLILIVLAGVVQYVSMKLAFSLQGKIKKLKEDHAKDNNKGKNKDKKKDSDVGKPEDFGEIVQQSTQQTMILFPALLIFGAYGFPIGLSIYWISQGLFGIAQQVYINRINLNSVREKLQKE
jgi:YidC/Oxa1 family membrane protein insertase